MFRRSCYSMPGATEEPSRTFGTVEPSLCCGFRAYDELYECFIKDNGSLPGSSQSKKDGIFGYIVGPLMYGDPRAQTPNPEDRVELC